MEPLTSLKDTASSLQNQDVPGAVWAFMTSLKALRKRDGSEEPFDAKKLRRSIAAALSEAGMRDDVVADRLVEQVVARLTKRFDGHTVPAFSDVRETVQ